MSMGKKALLMDDMPTFGQCQKALGEELFYVREGLARFKQSEQVSGMPSSDFEKYFETLLNAIYITPIRSCPVDADGDNDGVIDFYDSKPLDNAVRDLTKSEGKDLVFTVLKVLDKPERGTVVQNTKGLSYPCNGKEVNITFGTNDNVEITSVALYEDTYWFKVKSNESGLQIYIKYEAIASIVSDKIREISSLRNVYPTIEDKENKKIYNSNFGFIGWYVPEYGTIGVKEPIPRFVGPYGPCALFSMLMWKYCFDRSEYNDAEEFYTKWFINNEFQCYDENNDYYVNSWDSRLETKIYIASIDEIIKTAKVQLQQGYPIIISGSNSGGTPHYAVIVGYINNGNNTDDFIVIDPYNGSDTGIRYSEFVKSYPNETYPKDRKGYRVLYKKKTTSR